MYNLNEKVPITVSLPRIDLDAACLQARTLALYEFGVTDDGNFTKVDAARNAASVVIEFASYRAILSMGGAENVYSFNAFVEG
jgi:hypothetical protein